MTKYEPWIVDRIEKGIHKTTPTGSMFPMRRVKYRVIVVIGTKWINKKNIKVKDGGKVGGYPLRRSHKLRIGGKHIQKHFGYNNKTHVHIKEWKKGELWQVTLDRYNDPQIDHTTKFTTSSKILHTGGVQRIGEGSLSVDPKEVKEGDVRFDISWRNLDRRWIPRHPLIETR